MKRSSHYNTMDSYGKKKDGSSTLPYKLTGSSEQQPQGRDLAPNKNGDRPSDVNFSSSARNDPQQPQQLQGAIRTTGAPQGQQQPQQHHQSRPPSESTLRPLSSNQVYNLITGDQYNSRNGVPMKFILYCSATWCNPCKLLTPKIEELSSDPNFRGITFIKIDCSNPDTLSPELRKLLNIDAVPIVYSFLGNKQVNMVVGASISEIETSCEQLAKM